MRGSKAAIGHERVSSNGYTYVKVAEGWRLKHHIIAEEKLGRPLASNERACFADGDRSNLDPRNIEIRYKGSTSLRRRKAVVEARIEELKAELDDINSTLQIK